MAIVQKLRTMKTGDALEEEKAAWRESIDNHIIRFDQALDLITGAQSQTNRRLDDVITELRRNTDLTKDVLAVASVARKVGLWSRMVASFAKTKAIWSAKAARWLSFNIIRPVGFAAAGFVAIWQAYVQIPWHELMLAIKRYF
jgi:hypothetical protein